MCASFEFLGVPPARQRGTGGKLALYAVAARSAMPHNGFGPVVQRCPHMAGTTNSRTATTPFVGKRGRPDERQLLRWDADSESRSSTRAGPACSQRPRSGLCRVDSKTVTEGRSNRDAATARGHAWDRPGPKWSSLSCFSSAAKRGSGRSARQYGSSLR